jgi:hypothetical protein
MLKKVFGLMVCLLVIALLQPVQIFAATGLAFSNPDKDVKLFFPQSTSYKTKIVTVKDSGDANLQKAVEERLGGKLDPVFDAVDVPHIFYTVNKGNEVIGYIHGIDQKDAYGGMQVFLALDPTGKIVDMYYQKISSPEAKVFTDKAFTKQFKNITLGDFYYSDYMKEMGCGSVEKVDKIKDPSKKDHAEFTAIMRSVKLNLILSDKLVLNNKYESSYKGKKDTKDMKDM